MFGRRLAAVIRASLIYQRPLVVRQLIQVIRRNTYGGNHALVIVIKGCLIPLLAGRCCKYRCRPHQWKSYRHNEYTGQWPPGFCQDCQFG